MPDRKPRLFLSHASEQKNEVVIPLDDLLTADFDTWYDKKDIAPKGTLFSNISAALNWCDYAVLIISPEFVDREWTKAELRGAWTLQIDRKQSVIIPVWYNVKKSQVLHLSPILADIPAIVSIDPSTIADGIRFAVGVGEQAKEQYGPLARARQQLQGTLAMETAYNQIAYTSEGVNRLQQEWQNLKQMCHDNVSAFGAGSPFRVHESRPDYPLFVAVDSPLIQIEDFNRLQLRFQLHNVASNSIHGVKLRRCILLINVDPFEQVEAHFANDATFEVYCDADKTPIWRDNERKLWPSRTVIEDGFKLLYDRTDDAKNGRLFTHWSSRNAR
jgi:TIR domain